MANSAKKNWMSSAIAIMFFQAANKSHDGATGFAELERA
jgi:hypothetical protein